MRRRTCLAALAGSGSLLSGCLATRSVHQEPAEAEKATVTPTATPTSPTPTDAPTTPTYRVGDVPTDRIVEGEAVAESGLALRARRWFGFEHDTNAEKNDEEHHTATADDGWFVAYDFTLRNAGEERLESVPDAVFTLGIDGESYEHIHSFPGDVQFADVDHPEVRPLRWYDYLDPDERVSLQLVFDVPMRREYRHYFVWDHGSTVAGMTDPVYLLGDRATEDDR